MTLSIGAFTVSKQIALDSPVLAFGTAKIQSGGSPDPYGWEDLGGQVEATRVGGYLDLFLQDAQALEKTPVWITNGALEAPFATWLQQHGILHIIVAP